MQYHFRLIFAVILTILFSGCVPAISTFYEPLSKDGKVEQQYCHGHVGPRNTINYVRAAIRISVYTEKIKDRGLLLHISVKPSSEAELHFLSQDFEIKIDGQGHKIRPEKVVGFNTRPFNAQKSYSLERWVTLVGGRYDIYFMYLYLPVQEHSHFNLQFPSMTINGNALNILPINFSEKTEFFIFPINC